jgi:hypothetical protein
MKTLDLNACGVEEMNAGEMKTVEGGWWYVFSRFLVNGWGPGCSPNDVVEA